MAESRNYGPKSGKSGLPVNIIGNGFSTLSNVRVKFGQSAVAGEVKNDQHVKVEVPAGMPDGPVAIVLCSDGNPDIFVGGFTVGSVPPGTSVTDVYPDSIAAGGGTAVSIFGYGFKDVGVADAVTVGFGTATAQGTAVDSTLISVVAPAMPPRGGQQAFNVMVTFSDGSTFQAAELTCYI